jgi:molecular chaperone GrpE
MAKLTNEMTGKPRPDDETRAVSAAAGEPPTKGAVEAAPDQSGKPDTDQNATGDGVPGALTDLEDENAELKDRLLRALAEVENVRRRAERDLSDMRQYAITKFAGDMLNVADNLERAIASIPAEAGEGGGAVKTLIEGVKLTEKEVLGSLDKHGIKRLNPMGQRFDPNFHEALFAVPDPSVPNGTVINVMEPGYSIGSRVLRPAKVGVASGGAQSQATPGPVGQPKT